jgi:Fe2+ or Zn2+ uptake regulation protein
LPVCTVERALSRTKELRGGKVQSHVLYCLGLCPECNKNKEC